MRWDRLGRVVWVGRVARMGRVVTVGRVGYVMLEWGR